MLKFLLCNDMFFLLEMECLTFLEYFERLTDAFTGFKDASLDLRLFMFNLFLARFTGKMVNLTIFDLLNILSQPFEHTHVT